MQGWSPVARIRGGLTYRFNVIPLKPPRALLVGAGKPTRNAYANARAPELPTGSGKRTRTRW